MESAALTGGATAASSGNRRFGGYRVDDWHGRGLGFLHRFLHRFLHPHRPILYYAQRALDHFQSGSRLPAIWPAKPSRPLGSTMP